MINVLIEDIKIPVRSGKNPDYKKILNSIKKKGIINPIYLTSKANERKWTCLDGAARLEAANELAMEHIPAVTQIFDDVLDENLIIEHLCTKHVKLTYAEYKRVLKRLLAVIPIKELALKINRSVHWIKERLK